MYGYGDNGKPRRSCIRGLIEKRVYHLWQCDGVVNSFAVGCTEMGVQFKTYKHKHTCICMAFSSAHGKSLQSKMSSLASCNTRHEKQHAFGNPAHQLARPAIDVHAGFPSLCYAIVWACDSTYLDSRVLPYPIWLFPYCHESVLHHTTHQKDAFKSVSRI
jgi:hypothetical protein